MAEKMTGVLRFPIPALYSQVHVPVKIAGQLQLPYLSVTGIATVTLRISATVALPTPIAIGSLRARYFFDGVLIGKGGIEWPPVLDTEDATTEYLRSVSKLMEEDNYFFAGAGKLSIAFIKKKRRENR